MCEDKPSLCGGRYHTTCSTHTHQYTHTRRIFWSYLLHFQIIENKGFSQSHILLGLGQGISLGEKGHNDITNGPFFHGLVEDDVVAKKDHLKVRLVEATEYFCHGFGPGFLVHGTDTETNPITGAAVGRGRDGWSVLGLFVGGR